MAGILLSLQRRETALTENLFIADLNTESAFPTVAQPADRVEPVRTNTGVTEINVYTTDETTLESNRWKDLRPQVERLDKPLYGEISPSDRDILGDKDEEESSLAGPTVVPKGSSVAVPVTDSSSNSKEEGEKKETAAQPTAEKDNGQRKVKERGTQTLSDQT